MELPNDVAAHPNSFAQLRELDARSFPVQTIDLTVRSTNMRQADAIQHFEHLAVDVAVRF